MVSEMDPFLRLELLRDYMNRWIDEWPLYKKTFTEWLKRYHEDKIPGTKAYYMTIATHCYYCDSKFPKVHLSGDPQRKTIDHWHPKSLGGTERYVICCNLCNTKKGAKPPNQLVAEITRHLLRGRTMWGFHTKRLEMMAKQITTVSHDVLYNMGPRVYYIQR